MQIISIQEMNVLENREEYWEVGEHPTFVK